MNRTSPELQNRPAELTNYNPFSSHSALVDVLAREHTTRGAPGPGREYRLTGHKWFFSAPMCDAFLVRAQAPGGLSCFLVPRFLPDRVLQRKTAG